MYYFDLCILEFYILFIQFSFKMLVFPYRQQSCMEIGQHYLLEVQHFEGETCDKNINLGIRTLCSLHV